MITNSEMLGSIVKYIDELEAKAKALMDAHNKLKVDYARLNEKVKEQQMQINRLKCDNMHLADTIINKNREIKELKEHTCSCHATSEQKEEVPQSSFTARITTKIGDAAPETKEINVDADSLHTIINKTFEDSGEDLKRFLKFFS